MCPEIIEGQGQLEDLPLSVHREPEALPPEAAVLVTALALCHTALGSVVTTKGVGREYITSRHVTSRYPCN